MELARAALRDFLGRNPRVLALTGAGCSAPSGIPDYRDLRGAWKHGKPMSFAEFTGSAAARRRYWAGSLRGWPRVRDACPNPAHLALAALEAQGPLRGVVTQNVDGLHQRAGSRRVLDLHGRLDVVECLGCGARVGREDLQALLEAWNPEFESARAGDARPDGDTGVGAPLDGFRVPDCRECGGVLKPGVVFFGENVPRERVAAVHQALEAADALLIVGSSLMVWSGYRFVRAARERRLEVAALNLGRTRADAELNLKLEGDCAVVLPGALL
jgi:NAD-dependent SIR2 family protein deacetylase